RRLAGAGGPGRAPLSRAALSPRVASRGLATGAGWPFVRPGPGAGAPAGRGRQRSSHPRRRDAASRPLAAVLAKGLGAAVGVIDRVARAVAMSDVGLDSASVSAEAARILAAESPWRVSESVAPVVAGVIGRSGERR